MKIKEAYDLWSRQYDSEVNKTRDLENLALRDCVKDLRFENCLELGCGTGKNTGLLAQHSTQILAIDFSESMLDIARQKVQNPDVKFLIADLNSDWDFTTEKFDFITCSLVLEHIENLERIFRLMAGRLKTNGWLYIGELHPFKQYLGSKAKFSSDSRQRTVTCFTHHISTFLDAAESAGLKLLNLKEYFDEDNPSIPRILSIQFWKP